MGPKEINQQSITNFLASIGIYPERKYNGYWMYKSIINPEQSTGSLKVSLNNLWVDYSLSNTGGTLIDLILLLYPGLTIKDVLKKFDRGDFSFHQSYGFTSPVFEHRQTIKIITCDTIMNHSILCKYLSIDRAIDPIIADRYLKAFQYEVNGKKYWNLGTQNHLQGYNLFSKDFKCSTRQGVTFFKNKGVSTTIYFEGVIDFLSFLMLYPEQEYKHEYCVLNSVNNLKKILKQIKINSHIIACLDNDQAGDKATEILKKAAGDESRRFSDMRSRFKGYKDLNDFLIFRK